MRGEVGDAVWCRLMRESLDVRTRLHVQWMYAEAPESHPHAVPATAAGRRGTPSPHRLRDGPQQAGDRHRRHTARMQTQRVMTTATGTRRYGCYRLYNQAGELLYVGASKSPRSRLTLHRSRSFGSEIDDQKTTITWYETRVEAEAAEEAAITTEHPLHNIQGITGTYRGRTDRTQFQPSSPTNQVAPTRLVIDWPSALQLADPGPVSVRVWHAGVSSMGCAITFDSGEHADPVIVSLSMRGAQREITSRLRHDGYQPTARWAPEPGDESARPATVRVFRPNNWGEPNTERTPS